MDVASSPPPAPNAVPKKRRLAESPYVVFPVLLGILAAASIAVPLTLFFGIVMIPILLVVLVLYLGWYTQRRRRYLQRQRGPDAGERPS
jgi:hypothetical protein